MIHKTHELVSRLPVHEALERIKGLLTREGVKYTAADRCLTSTQTPIVHYMRGYIRSNWIGVNPFNFVTGVKVRCESGDNGLTRVVVRINRFRTFFILAWLLLIFLLAAFDMPKPGGAIFFVSSACVGWLVMVAFLGDYLIIKEIADQLKNGTHQHR